MRVACFVNNWLGWKCVEAIRANGDQIVALVMHPTARRSCGERILQAAGVTTEQVFAGERLTDEETLRGLRATTPELGVSIMFGYILKPICIEMFPRGVINLHPSYLPYNRGHFPNVWSIVDRTPAGVTLHYIDEGVDTGDIIAQDEVDVASTDTGETLYRRLEHAGLQLFVEKWPLIVRDNIERRPQNGSGTSHRSRDVQNLDRIDLDKCYPARDLIDLLRARTFSGYPGAYFEEDGQRVFLRLQLEPESHDLH